MKKIIMVNFCLIFCLSLQSCNLFSAAGFTSQGQPIRKASEIVHTPKQEIVDHYEWDQLLKKYVDENGLVDYKGFLKDRDKLQSYLNMLSNTPPKESWGTAELLAYYINTYNAYTVALILEHYPVESIKDINGAWTKGIVPIGDKNLSLGGIENGILRKMDEPRIHFAINCASYSCPDLLNEAYTASKIERQLQKVTIAFINGNKNQLSAENPKLSHIFKWYKRDFKVNGEKDLIGYINQFTDIPINPDASIDYLEYDWSLNEQR